MQRTGSSTRERGAGFSPAVRTPRTAAPRYSPFRRQQDWEPQGRWLSARPQLSWPDTVLSPAVVRWLPRIMLLVAVGLCAMTIGTITDSRGFLILLGLAVLVGGWQEWWTRWELTGLRKKLVAFGVLWLLGLAMVIVNPLASFFCFTGFMIAGTLFTGWWLLASVVLVGAQVSIGQVGGIALVGPAWPMYVALVVINSSISVAFVTLSNRREEAVANRDAAVRELLVTQRANEALQQQLVRSAHDTGIRAERGRLARELHDTVAQSLVAMITQLEAIEAGAVDPGPRTRIERSIGLARDALTEARRAVNALSPAALEDGELPDVIRGLLADRLGGNGIESRVRVEGWPRRTGHDAVLTRICQEALANIHQHSAAEQVTVTLTYLDDEVLLDIADDGVGFDPATLPRPSVTGGHGLRGMGERVELAGGRLTVESEPGCGTVISAAVSG